MKKNITAVIQLKCFSVFMFILLPLLSFSVLFTGKTALVIFLFILALRAILGKRKKIKQHIQNPETNNW